MSVPAAEPHTGAHGAPAPAAAVEPRRWVPLALKGTAALLAGTAIGGAVLLKDSGPDPLLNYALLMTGAVAAGVGALWTVIGRHVLRAGTTLAAEARVIAHGTAGARIPVERYGDLAPVARAVNELADKLAGARRDIDRAVAESTAKAEQQKSRLAAILQELHEGVLVCNLKHQILLYNQTALDLLHLTGDLGLGRSLLHFVLPEPIHHTLERLTLRVREGRHIDHAHGTTAQFVGSTTDGRILLEGRMSVILQETDAAEGAPEITGPEITGPEITGYVITLSDATRELAALGQRDALLREATEGFRGPIANLQAALETLIDTPDLGPEDRRAFERAMMDSCTTLAERLEHVTSDYRSVMSGSWPMSDIHSNNLLNLVRHRVRDDAGYRVTLTGLPQWTHCDSFSAVVLVDHLIRRIHEISGVAEFDLSADHEGQWIYVDVTWSGAPVPSGTVDGWLDDPLADALGGLTVGDVLQHHKSTLWCEALKGREGCARLRVPLPPALSPPTAHQAAVRTTSRPEFFDFNLLHQPLATSELGRTPLDALHYVVFDTETTGLSPSQGDEIIQVAAVRLVNGRILTGETFNQLVNPGRKIPPESIPFHHITEDMVADQPTIDKVLPQFRSFVSGAVMVAHNAAFDLKFLKMKERAAGVRFDGPVLDTMLLSRMLQGDGGDHTLDGIAQRLGIEVVDRHTALGDSLVTAAIFLRMIDMLRERDIRTLDDAIRGANILVELAARERAF
ncbi:exonuclease domain-containing protein [Azospirillum sp. TSO22-1]|uniref:3'-5' exonuclease n=1 Tax=Azospirillum sp. TSO22-1 TaxID=716789 RepID=UPI000D61A7B3|nr:exonuclease domain-containing protein [Azospirillum sp. TSO22-1]PWC38242.1 exonuclease [Azospirillum sp. TSO22-1]